MIRRPVDPDPGDGTNATYPDGIFLTHQFGLFVEALDAFAVWRLNGGGFIRKLTA
ncbi:MAG: hypothetical protein P1U58_08505 [Verrucomicrobiales bacterium]|nr:hypothetical protein [Verrucomicrobiales bacterium]